MAKRKATSNGLIEALRKTGRKYPEFAGKYALLRVQKAAATSKNTDRPPRCIRWGEDPVTGKRICLEWG